MHPVNEDVAWLYNNKYIVVKNQEVIPGHFLMCFESRDIAVNAVPGQFLHIRCNEGLDPVLRRPFSIHFIRQDKNLVYILYRVLGRGTSLLAKVKPGEKIDVLGPLGKGFTLPRKGEKVAVLGGGIGAAPLFFLLDEIRKEYHGEIDNVAVLLGAVNKDMIPGIHKITEMGFSVHIATDDGSCGFKGTVVDLYRQVAGKNQVQRVYACGPKPMLKALAAAVDPGIEAEISIEEYMGCGLGVCLSCVCKVKGYKGETVNAHVCTDGPVFELKKVLL